MLQVLEKNSLSIYQSRNENVIRHPLEAYAEVSVTSLDKGTQPFVVCDG